MNVTVKWWMSTDFTHSTTTWSCEDWSFFNLWLQQTSWGNSTLLWKVSPEVRGHDREASTWLCLERAPRTCGRFTSSSAKTHVSSLSIWDVWANERSEWVKHVRERRCESAAEVSPWSLVHSELQQQVTALIEAMRENKVRKQGAFSDGHVVTSSCSASLCTGAELRAGLETCDHICRRAGSLLLLHRPSKRKYWNGDGDIPASCWNNCIARLCRIICLPRITATTWCSVWTFSPRRWGCSAISWESNLSVFSSWCLFAGTEAAGQCGGDPAGGHV